MNHSLELFSQWLELLLNTVEFFGVFISLCLLAFFLTNSFSRALRDILGPLGMGGWARFKALFLCGRGIVRKRAFIEYALFTTEGRLMSSRTWHGILTDFHRNFADKTPSEMVLSMPNCTKLLGDAFNEASKRYFDFFKDERQRRAFGLPESGTSWVFRIQIEEAYITPTCLLTGLLAQYNEQWSAFISRYVSMAFSGSSERAESVPTDELYLTFAWLLWGPSVEIAYRDYWDGLCQISYGDESNSIPAFASQRGGSLASLQKAFKDVESRHFGLLAEVSVRLHDSLDVFRNFRDIGNPDNAYFHQKIEKDKCPFTVLIDEFVPTTSFKADKYYCTAYVWLLFERLQPGDNVFRPERSVAFFEHANLADRESYGFFVSTLSEKALAHFRKVSKIPERSGTHYRLVCALNKDIQRAFRQRMEEVSRQDPEFGVYLASHVDLHTIRAPEEVFSAFDSFFGNGKGLSFLEVTIDDQDSLVALGEFFIRIYTRVFPDPDERETLEGLIHYLRRATQSQDYRYHILLARDDEGNMAGGAVFDYFPASNSGIIEFIAVRPESERAGFGTRLFERVRHTLRKDAAAYGQTTLSWIFCEIDSPEHSKQHVMKYFSFWGKNHFRRIDFNYVQPALSAHQQSVKGLWFIAARQPDALGHIESKTSISAMTLLSVLSDYLRFCMDISHPEKHDVYRDMEADIRSKGDVVALSKLPSASEAAILRRAHRSMWP